MGAQNRRVRHAAPFATVGGQTGLSDNDGSFRRANQPDRPQCFCRCGHVGRLFPARLGKQPRECPVCSHKRPYGNYHGRIQHGTGKGVVREIHVHKEP